MDKVAIFSVLILLGLFVVYMINNKIIKPQPAIQHTDLTVPSMNTSTSSLSPSPSQNQTANLTPSESSSRSSQIQATSAVIKTSKGNIEISFYSTEAPNTVANFVNKSKSGFYDNLIFHRVEDWVIQGGDPLGTGTGGGSMPVEFNDKPFVVGAVGIASKGDGKVQNDAQFFIVKTDAQFLNGQYTNFGIVTKGMDVAEKMEIGDEILGITVE